MFWNNKIKKLEKIANRQNKVFQDVMGKAFIEVYCLQDMHTSSNFKTYI